MAGDKEEIKYPMFSDGINLVLDIPLRLHQKKYLYLINPFSQVPGDNRNISISPFIDNKPA